MYVTGILDQQELDDLRARGWEAETPPVELITERHATFKDDLPYCPEDGTYFVQFFVDSDLFAVMTGPDWEGPPTTGSTAPAAPL